MKQINRDGTQEKFTRSTEAAMKHIDFFKEQIKNYEQNDFIEKEQFKPIDESKLNKNNIGDTHVCVRLRPLLNFEIEKNYFQTQIVANPHVHFLDIKQNYNGEPEFIAKKYKVDYAFGPEDDDDKVYECVGQQAMNMALKGGIGFFLAYGQTGSGKTHTISNLINRIARDLFDKNEENKEIYVSYMEVTFQMYDLLNNRSPVDVKGGTSGLKPRYIGLSQHLVNNTDEFQNLIDKAIKQRFARPTQKSPNSSRSVAILRLVIKDPKKPKSDDGELMLVDMPGSEYTSDYQHHNDKQMMETQFINWVINEVKTTFINKAEAAKGKKVHINQSLFALNKAIMPAFDIKSKQQKSLVVFGNIAPSHFDIAQTKNTLEYCGPIKAGGGGKGFEVAQKTTQTKQTNTIQNTNVQKKPTTSTANSKKPAASTTNTKKPVINNSQKPNQIQKPKK